MDRNAEMSLTVMEQHILEDFQASMCHSKYIGVASTGVLLNHHTSVDKLDKHVKLNPTSQFSIKYTIYL